MKTALITLGLLAAALPAAAATISLAPSTLAPLQGQHFTVDVVVQDNSDTTEITAFGFDVLFSPGGLLSLSSVTFHPLFIDTPLGGTSVGAVLNELIGPTGSPVTLATLHLTAGPGTGLASLVVLSNPGDPNLGLFVTDLSDFSSRTEDIFASASFAVQAVPEPATTLLTAAALVAGAVLRRRARA